MILDTEYLGALVNRNEGARAKARELSQQATPTRIPCVVLWEVYTGIGNVSDTEFADYLRTAYERLKADRSTISLDAGVSRRAGELNGMHMNSDVVEELDGADSIIATHGLRLDEPVLTNDSDFRDVDGLDVETY